MGKDVGKDDVGNCEVARGGGVERRHGEGSGNYIMCRMYEETGACQSRKRTHPRDRERQEQEVLFKHLKHFSVAKDLDILRVAPGG